jgi:bifunctional UDP-N-acetylglucosamine pyrophosphorylase/glucosamine-1-phosphate N-acetyltransferase
MSTTAIILAAGKSTRMKSNRPKAMHEVCGQPILHYILTACWDAGCQRAIVVVGHAKEEIISAFGDDKRITFVEQTEQLGTGHAARMCEPELRKMHGGDVFILAGDGPLIRGEVLRTLANVHHDEKAAASMATAILEDPTGYGRIIRDAKGDFVEIVEQVDCSLSQLEIKEVFPSYYCVRVEPLLWALEQLKPNNRKGEYYLTDIYGHLRSAGKKVLALQCVTAEDVLAVNTRQQLVDVDAVLQDRIQRSLRENGVSIPSPFNTYVEDGVSIGMDTVLQPFTFVGRGASIGADCCIGPFACVPRDGIVPEGTTIAGNVTAADTTGSKV